MLPVENKLTNAQGNLSAAHITALTSRETLDVKP